LPNGRDLKLTSLSWGVQDFGEAKLRLRCYGLGRAWSGCMRSGQKGLRSDLDVGETAEPGVD